MCMFVMIGIKFIVVYKICNNERKAPIIQLLHNAKVHNSSSKGEELQRDLERDLEGDRE